MAVGQMGAVTGRKVRPDYLTGIEAKSAALPRAYQIEENKRINDERMALAQDQFGLQKDQMKRANRISYANLGIGAAGALGNFMNADDGVAEPIAKAVTSALPGISNSIGGGEAFIQHDGLLEADSGILGAVDDYLLTPAVEGLDWIDDNLLGGYGEKVYDYAADAVTGFAENVWEWAT